MRKFLDIVAEDLHERIGNDFSRTLIVFPNRRAQLFLDEMLASRSDVPIWAPQYSSIHDFFVCLSPYHPADSIDVACRIYDIYHRLCSDATESLDFFFGWAVRLLEDFQEVDKSMVNAAALFLNMADIRALDSNDYLTAEQAETLRRFFASFDLDSHSRIQEKFLMLWQQLLPIYNELNSELFAEGLAYEGALMRHVVEELEAGRLEIPDSIERIVFIGLNVLSEVEKRLFKYCKQHAETLFYWDYDTYYLNKDEHEAGAHLSENKKVFPDALSEKLFDNFLTGKHIEFVAASSDNQQARSVSDWLRNIPKSQARDTAVVMCDENLLLPVLHSLPETVDAVNITKGFPLHHGVAYNVFEDKFRSVSDTDTDLMKVLNELSDSIQERATSMREELMESDEKSYLRPLAEESFFQIYKIINRFKLLVEAGRLNVTAATLHRLMRQVIKSTSIPFHGEPLEGVQIMGVLETRNLDFDNIVILSCNEGMMPQARSNNSFIPYFLREAYHLPTTKQDTAIYAYYFYRMLQRAENVRIVYNASQSNSNSGEMSRFMHQLAVESPQLNIKYLSLITPPSPSINAPAPIPKPRDTREKLLKLSPSAVNVYLTCQLRFYYECLCNIREQTNTGSIIESNVFGTVFHRAAEYVYLDMSENYTRPITREIIEEWLADRGVMTLDKYVSDAFLNARHDPNEKHPEPPIEENVLVASVIKKYLINVLEYDRACTPINLVGVEKKLYDRIEVDCNGEKREILYGGIIDRVDSITLDGREVMRIIDYKTGGNNNTIKNRYPDLDSLFKPSSNRQKYILQTYMYAMNYLNRTKLPILPCLFYVAYTYHPDFSLYVTETATKTSPVDFREREADFRLQLKNIFAEILDMNRDFEPTEDLKHCNTCPFFVICRK